jgi:radical SAM superfamily enzyme YgiQ (UPF0313 family)
MDLDLGLGELVPIGQDSPPNAPNLAVYLLAAVLRTEGHHVTVMDLTAQGTNKIDGWLDALGNSDLVGISATSLNWPTARTVASQIRSRFPQLPIVVGGVHPTMFSEYILERFNGVIDYVIRYEGERPLVELCRALERHQGIENVPNLVWRSEDGQIIHNALAPLLTPEELASLPVPAYDLLPPNAYPSAAIQTSRGCAFNCVFCSTSYRRSYRAIAPLAVVDNMEEILSLARGRFVLEGAVFVVDDEWSLDRKRTVAILREVDRRGLSVKFTYDSRANDFLYDDYAQAVAPRTQQFLVGAECGYDEGLKRVGKGATVEKFERCAAVLARYGIAERASFSFVLGLPWEGKEEVLKTVRFASQLVCKYGVNVLLQWYYQIPGSVLWDEFWARGEVTPGMYEDVGFFRDLHLFRSGVKLSPAEIWEVVDTIRTAHSLCMLLGRARAAFAYSIPAPIELYYPRLQSSPGAGPGTLLIASRRREQRSKPLPLHRPQQGDPLLDRRVRREEVVQPA